MNRQSHPRQKQQEGRAVAGAHRSRAGQNRANIEKEMQVAENVGTTPPDMQGAEMSDELRHDPHDEFHDSELPPPPQIRRARTTADPSKKVKDKNTGIKHRDASGKKHSAR
ncbi:MAG TPA: hypothetical protein VEK08_22865 [Planctomycetota bacterium]|nr:hypothetical protein [Planctomycetota bacterium]